MLCCQLLVETVIVQGCDDFTRNFLKKLGVRVPNSDETPEDPFNKRRSEVLSYECYCDVLLIANLYFS